MTESLLITELTKTLKLIAEPTNTTLRTYGDEVDFTAEFGDRAVSINRWKRHGEWHTKIGWPSSSSCDKGIDPMREQRRIFELADLAALVIEAVLK